MLTDLYNFGCVYLNELNCQGIFDTVMKRDRAVGFEHWPQTDPYVCPHENIHPLPPPRSRVRASWMTAVVKKALLLLENTDNECWTCCFRLVALSRLHFPGRYKFSD